MKELFKNRMLSLHPFGVALSMFGASVIGYFVVKPFGNPLWGMITGQLVVMIWQYTYGSQVRANGYLQEGLGKKNNGDQKKITKLTTPVVNTVV